MQLPPEVRLRCHATVPSANQLARRPLTSRKGAVNRRWSWCWRCWTAAICTLGIIRLQPQKPVVHGLMWKEAEPTAEPHH
jgi:hypothetical protein